MPDFVIPYKQHISFTIEKAVKESLLNEEILAECIPDAKTMKRWRSWVEEKILKINSDEHKISKKNRYIQKYSITIPLMLNEIVLKRKEWLSAVLDLPLLNFCTCLSLS